MQLISKKNFNSKVFTVVQSCCVKWSSKNINSFRTCENYIRFVCQFVSNKISTSCLLHHAAFSVLWSISLFVTLDQLVILFSLDQLESVKCFFSRLRKIDNRENNRESDDIFLFSLSIFFQIGYYISTLWAFSDINSHAFYSHFSVIEWYYLKSAVSAQVLQ